MIINCLSNCKFPKNYKILMCVCVCRVCVCVGVSSVYVCVCVMIIPSALCCLYAVVGEAAAEAALVNMGGCVAFTTRPGVLAFSSVFECCNCIR